MLKDTLLIRTLLKKPCFVANWTFLQYILACYHKFNFLSLSLLSCRLALIGKKHWRQFLKTLTVVEFLLFHGPEQVAMEFSSDRDLIEDLTRFNYVSERG